MLSKTLMLLLTGTLMVACGNANDDDTNGSGGSGAATGGSAGSTGGSSGATGGSSGATGGSSGATGGSSGATGGSAGTAGSGGTSTQYDAWTEDAPVGGTCSVVTFDLHSDAQYYVTLQDMQTHTVPPGEYSFVMQKLHPAPIVYLGPGVQAINLGPNPDFDGVTTAPDSGYATDEPEPIIGRNYQSGGSGSTGFDMSGNVFVLMHPDGSYAKLSWTSAVAGVVTINAYWGTTADLTCSW